MSILNVADVVQDLQFLMKKEQPLVFMLYIARLPEAFIHYDDFNCWLKFSDRELQISAKYVDRVNELFNMRMSKN